MHRYVWLPDDSKMFSNKVVFGTELYRMHVVQYHQSLRLTVSDFKLLDYRNLEKQQQQIYRITAAKLQNCDTTAAT